MGDEIHALLLDAVDDVVHRKVDEQMPDGASSDDFDPEEMIKAINAHFQVEVAYDPNLGTHYEEVAKDLSDKVKAAYDKRESDIVQALKRAADAHGQGITDEAAKERW